MPTGIPGLPPLPEQLPVLPQMPPGTPGVPPPPPADPNAPPSAPPANDPAQPPAGDPSGFTPPEGSIFTPGVGWHMPGQGGQMGGSGWTGSGGGWQGQGGYRPNYNDGQTYGGVSPTRVGPVTPESMAGFGEFEDAAYDAAVRRLDPQFQAQERAFRQRMVNQGISEGSEAFDNAYANFTRDRNDAYSGARRGALADALAAQQQAFQQQFGQSELANRIATTRIGADASRYGSDQSARASMYGTDAGRANFTDQLDFNRGEADFRNLMSLLGYGSGVNSNNNQMLGYDQGRAGVFNGMIPGVNPSQIDVTGPYAAYQQGLQNNANAQNSADAAAQQQQMQAAMMAASFFLSSREAKVSFGALEPNVALEAIASLEVDRWQYLDAAEIHVGPYAEDFNQAITGTPKKTISVIDMLGTLVGAVQGVHALLKQQNARLDALEAAHAAG